MQMLKTYYFFRIKQLGRYLRSAGWPGLLALPIAMIFLLSLWEALSEMSWMELGSLVVLPAAFWHFSRSDWAFLRKLQLPVRLLAMGEYTLVSLLLVALPVYTNAQWKAVLWAVLLSSILAFTPKPGKQSALAPRPWTSWIPIYLFEWRLALRRHWALWVLIGLISLLSPLWVGSLLLAALMGAALLPSVFEHYESSRITFSLLRKPAGLQRYLAKHSLALCLFFLPGSLLHWIFHPELWYFPLIACLILCLMTAFSIAHKYARYSPGQVKNQASITATLVFGGIILPVFLPFVVGYVIYLWRQAINNLHFQYHCAYVSHQTT
jgi:hypothetical protein